jgi:4-hydroxy-3-methylbut-2-en-1-yl diphosphate reductase
MQAKPPLKIVLCSPRGFCAGVVRAIDTVERALTIYGAPVYVRHEIVAMLKERFPNISGPHKEDICYATTNRQLAVKKVAPVVDALIVVGAPNSSNSQRLREVAEREGCPIAVLAQRASDIDWSRFEGIKTLGITAGASAPEVIVEEIMGAFAERYQLHVETVSAAEENEFFPLPRSLRPDAAE